MRWFDSIWKILNLEPFSLDNCCCLCCLGWAKTVYCIHENSQTTHYTARMRDEFSATKIVCIHGTVDLIWTNTNFHCLESTVKNQHDSHSIGWSDERECAVERGLDVFVFWLLFCVCVRRWCVYNGYLASLILIFNWGYPLFPISSLSRYLFSFHLNFESND